MLSRNPTPSTKRSRPRPERRNRSQPREEHRNRPRSGLEGGSRSRSRSGQRRGRSGRSRPGRSRSRTGRSRRKGMIRISVRSTLNNLFLVASTRRGGVLHRLSVGSAGFPGPRRPAPLSAEQTARQFSRHLLSSGFKRVELRLPTLINSRVRKALYGLERGGLWVRGVRLVPPVAHNGVRLKKARRS